MENRKKIDEIDATILKILLKESRTSFTQLSKVCNISVCAVRMRFNRLKKAGIIVGEQMYMNPKFWGYEAVADVGIETAIGYEKEVKQFLQNKRYITLVGPFGRYNCFCLILLPTIGKLGRLLQEIEANPHIKLTEAFIWAEDQNIDHAENLIIEQLPEFGEKNEKENKSPVEFYKADIDEIDRKIAKILSENSRMSFNEIAKRLQISIHNVINRYNRLREGNVLTRSTIAVDLNKLGYKASYANFIKISNKIKMPEIVDQLLKVQNMIHLIKYIGRYDLRVDFAISNIDDIFAFNEIIHKIQGIEKVDTAIVRIPQWWPMDLFNKHLK
ncbi:MAG: Lrp/AsnC family transcriptional regulator [Candidatus Bathyarchaeota archaeon]|nr:Lrp/AsnC family transcriptional regulator [Candidatus Bathyarchaeota archaeon]